MAMGTVTSPAEARAVEAAAGEGASPSPPPYLLAGWRRLDPVARGLAGARALRSVAQGALRADFRALPARAALAGRGHWRAALRGRPGRRVPRARRWPRQRPVRAPAIPAGLPGGAYGLHPAGVGRPSRARVGRQRRPVRLRTRRQRRRWSLRAGRAGLAGAPCPRPGGRCRLQSQRGRSVSSGWASARSSAVWSRFGPRCYGALPPTCRSSP